MNTPPTISRSDRPSHRLHLLLPFLLLLLSAGSCDLLGTGDDPGPSGPIVLRTLSTQEKQLVQGSNDFSFRLLKALAARDTTASFFASPLSVSMAFGMALNGAGSDSETYRQIRDLFGHDGLTNAQINAAARDLIKALVDLDPKVALTIANSIWIRQGFEVQSAFLEANRDFYLAEVRSLDFSDPGAPGVINAWIDEKTKGLIKKMIDSISDQTVLYLINAIHFKADWQIAFDPKKTQEVPFTLADGSTVNRPLMQREDTLSYVQDQQWTAVDLAYGGQAFSFLAIQPNDPADLDASATEFTQQDYQSIVEGLERRSIPVHLPKFELDHEIKQFSALLQDLGLTAPFAAGEADFSRINASQPLHISDVLHRAVITLDEKGTEAAAVTVIEIRVTSVGPMVVFDRPFLFFIRERTSGTILFMGRYSGN